jgi:PBP1b-binding outer membrane lipoprotein LpoB
MTALAAIVLSGCTSTTATTDSRSTKPINTTEKKVYSKEELDKRGRQTPADALAAQDEEITISHH